MTARSALLLLAAVAGLSTLAPEALALMPPHVSHTVPANGETLEGDTIVFHGYSLEYADTSDVTVVNISTSEPVELSTALDCQWEGDDPPGHVGGTQLRCELKVTLQGLQAGHRYKASYMDTELEFTSAGAPATPEPEAPVPAPTAPPTPETTD